jgi:glycosyltransferase involved in cell wall biosynthesis
MSALPEPGPTKWWEHVIVDGASTDETHVVLDDARREGRIVVSEPDNGIYDAMNKGTACASGRFVWFLNSGDVPADATVLNELEKRLELHGPLDWLIGRAQHGGGRHVAPHYVDHAHNWLDYALGRQPHVHQAVFFGRDLLDVLSGYDVNTPLVADFDLMLRAGLVRRPVRLDFCVVKYQGSGASDAQRAALPLLKHDVRVRRLELHGMLAHIDRLYAVYQAQRLRSSRAARRPAG